VEMVMLGLKVLQMSVNFSPKSDHPSWYFSKNPLPLMLGRINENQCLWAVVWAEGWMGV